MIKYTVEQDGVEYKFKVPNNTFTMLAPDMIRLLLGLYKEMTYVNRVDALVHTKAVGSRVSKAEHISIDPMDKLL